MSTGSHEDHSQWYELVAGQALHALDHADEERLRIHLSGCQECRTELDGHSLTASHLASLADDPASAPPSWSKIRAAVVGTEPSAVAVLADRRDRRRPGRLLLAAAAAAVVLSGATVVAWQGLNSHGGSASTPSALAHCAQSPACQVIDLRSSDGSRRAAVLVSNGNAQVQPITLQGAPAGRTFVLWQLPRSGAPIALGEFGSTTAASSPAALAVAMAQTTAFAVSSEPVGAAPKKPTDVLALGGVTA